jgi:hypothetical protein
MDMASDLNDIELHDANLLSIATDHRERTVTVTLAYHPVSATRQRVDARLKFFDVVRMQETADLEELQGNAWAGNVVSWLPSQGPGTTYIHLARGFIAITAARLDFEPV